MFSKVSIKEQLFQSHLMSLLTCYVPKIQPTPDESESLQMKLEIYIINKPSPDDFYTHHITVAKFL